MAARPQIVERTPVEGVEIEYTLAPGNKRTSKPRFTRGRLLGINETEVELGSREAFQSGAKLSLVMHTRSVQNFLKIDATVTGCNRITVLKQPAYGVTLEFGKVAKDQQSKIAWATEQYAPRDRAASRVRREAEPAETPSEPAPPEQPVEAPEPEAAAPQPEAPPVRTPPAAGGQVKRPVALLELIGKMDDLEVTDDLIMAVIEAAEAAMDVEVLFGTESSDDGFDEEEESAGAEQRIAEGPARLINVYRLAPNTNLHFSESGMPAGPPSEMLYLSRLKAPDTCFGIDLRLTSMTHDGTPSFQEGTVLLFSTTEPVENGCFAYMKVRGNDRFAQVFLEKNDEVRIRFLNPAHPEEIVKRREVRVMCRLIGRYEPF